MIEPVAAFRIVKRPNANHWVALPHRMLHGRPVSADDAVRSVSGGHSCYVAEAGLAEVVARLTQGGINVVVEFADKGSRAV